MHATKPTHFECLDCTVRIDPQNTIRLLNIYRPPSSSMPGFLEEFFDVISETTLQNPELFVFGDFNIHLDNNNKPETREFLNLLSLYGLTSQIAAPTHTGAIPWIVF